MAKVRDYLGPYRLLRLIRTGSTCQVWEAIKEDTNERFALKVLRPDQRDNRDELSQLKHEFEVASGLKHPNIVKVIEFNEDVSNPFTAMELFSEVNLKLLLRKGPATIAYLVPQFIEHSCKALYYLHQKGWVHCDIKPDNFLVSPTGDTKLIDFTIAQKKMQKKLLRFFGIKGTVKGTRSYMSPEQIRDEPLDDRADLYSFGCVLFELITGKMPYTGSTPSDLLSKHLSSPIPSSQVYCENVTPEFSDLIKRLMAKKREHRPINAWDFLKEFSATRPFKKVPRAPTENVFENIPTLSEDLLR